MKIKSLLLAISIFSLSLYGCSKEQKNQRPKTLVETQSVKFVDENLSIKLVGHILPNSQTSTAKSIFTIQIPLPDGVSPALKIGEQIEVRLPFVNSKKAMAEISKIGPQLEARLPHQIHDLTGHRLDVIVPIKKNRLAILPFQSIYSPRGTTTEIFVLKNGRVSLTKVTPIQLVSEKELLVVADLEKAALVVTAGFENLINNDEVEVVSKKEQK